MIINLHTHNEFVEKIEYKNNFYESVKSEDGETCTNCALKYEPCADAPCEPGAYLEAVPKPFSGLKVKKLHPRARIEKPKNNDIGYDIWAVEANLKRLPDGSRLVTFETGVSIEMPSKDMACLVFPRSSIKNYPFQLTNSVGLVDPDYRGGISLAFRVAQIVDDGYGLQVAVSRFMNNAIAQLVFVPTFNKMPIQFCEELSETERGSKGYGSTNEK